MITRIYVDNFRCFVNFEWKPGRLALLLGDNGSGKSTLIDLLIGLRALMVDRAPVRHVFPRSSKTRWDTRLEQRFELDVVVDGRPFSYRLTVKHDAGDPDRAIVQAETLRSGDTPLMDFASGELQLYGEDGAPGPKVTVPGTSSVLAVMGLGRPNSGLPSFLQWVTGSLSCFFPNPRGMSSRTDEDGSSLAPDLANLASWYPRWVVSHFAAGAATAAALTPVLPGFDSLNVNPQNLRLQARFRGGGTAWDVDWSELSDGQRQLIGLYLLRHAFLGRAGTVIVDEPDNYVALREIQPWLTEAIDLASSPGGPQVWFVSHHPEVLNQLAREYGQQLVRPDNGPVRIEKFPDPDALTPAELVAGGWNHE